MAIKLHTETINGAKWSLNTLPATASIDVFTWLLALIGEPLGRVGAGAARGDGGVAALLSGGGDALGRAIGALTGKLADPRTPEMLKVLLTGITREVGGKPDKIDFDNYFSGNLGELLEVALFAMKANFQSFFVGNQRIAGLVQRLGERKDET